VGSFVEGEPFPNPGDDGATWGCVLPFDTDDPEFARGVEVGMLYAELTCTGEFEGIVRGSNTEMVMRIAEKRGLPFVADSLDGDWFVVRIG
jgi:hypothetical protein